MKNRFFKLPFVFDEYKLLKDLEICQEIFWGNHFNKQDYTGNWTSIALRSATGEVSDIRAQSGNYSDTILLEKCTYFKEVTEQFLCEKESIRLLALAPGSEIKTHRDLEQAYEYGFARIHIPITTNKLVSFCVDNNEVPMSPGECWYANFNLPHSVSNNGQTTRIHLVVDCLRNAWTDDLFLQAGYDFEEEKERQQKKYDSATQAKIIAELNAMNTEASRQLIKQLLGENDSPQ